MTNPGGLILPDEGIAPDSSAPYPIVIAPSGAVQEELQIVQAYASTGVSVGFGGQVTVPGTALNITPIDFARRFSAISFCDVRALGGAGFGFSVISLFISPTHPMSDQRPGVMFYVPSGVGGSMRGNITGHAVRFNIPAGDTFQIWLDVAHGGVGGTCHCETNSGYTAWLERA